MYGICANGDSKPLRLYSNMLCMHSHSNMYMSTFLLVCMHYIVTVCLHVLECPNVWLRIVSCVSVITPITEELTVKICWCTCVFVGKRKMKVELFV